MSLFDAQPGDEVLPSGVIVRTCENGCKMYIGIGHERHFPQLTDEEFWAQIEAEPIPDTFVPSGHEWWD